MFKNSKLIKSIFSTYYQNVNKTILVEKKIINKFSSNASKLRNLLQSIILITFIYQ